MSRDLDSDMVTAVTGAKVYPIILTEADFDSGQVCLWNGLGTLTVEDKDYQGIGTLLRADPGTETSEIEAQNATLELSGIASEDIAVALGEDYQGRGSRIKLGFFYYGADGTDPESILDPIRLFTGRMDVMTIGDDPDSPTITMTAENDMVRLNRARDRRYTHEDQQIDYPGDLFFEFVTSMQDKQILWG